MFLLVVLCGCGNGSGKSKEPPAEPVAVLPAKRLELGKTQWEVLSTADGMVRDYLADPPAPSAYNLVDFCRITIPAEGKLTVLGTTQQWAGLIVALYPGDYLYNPGAYAGYLARAEGIGTYDPQHYATSPRFSVTLPPGKYVIAVHHRESWTAPAPAEAGGYELRTSFFPQPSPGENFVQGKKIDPNSLVTGTLDSHDPKWVDLPAPTYYYWYWSGGFSYLDAYRVVLPSRGTLTAEMCSLKFPTSVMLYSESFLADPAGAEGIWGDTASNDGMGSKISAELDAGVYIVVTSTEWPAPSEASGDYVLRTTFSPE